MHLLPTSVGPDIFIRSGQWNSSSASPRWRAGRLPWTASSSVPWVTITSGSTGAGNGTVAYTVAANPSSVARSGNLTIANQTYTVTQGGNAATPNCTASVPSVPQVEFEGRTEVCWATICSVAPGSAMR